MEIHGLLLDVEGVLVTDKRYQAVETAVDFVACARAAHCPLRLITNNTTDDRPAIIGKLRRAGFDFHIDELHTCTSAAVKRLQELGVERVLVLGASALCQIFTTAGFHAVDDAQAQAVVVGLDTNLTYRRLQIACEAILDHDAALIALHRNRLYGDATGHTGPSVGPIVAALECATQAEATIIGKPSRDYYQQALDQLRLAPDGVLVVSDDPFSDLAGAKRMGMHAAFVLSGKYRDTKGLDKIPPDQRPDTITPRIGDLLTSGTIVFANM